MNILNHITTITSPTMFEDSSFEYKANRWNSLDNDCKRLVHSYEDKRICREDVIKAFREFYLKKTDWRKPFVLTMIWGFADTGYGAHRTVNYLMEENWELIEDALIAIENRKLEEAYKSLYGIKGLGVSYITKILYFATRAIYLDGEYYALIFDIRVARGLVKLTAPQVYWMLDVYPSTKFRDYEKYIDLMHKTAKEHKIKAEELELFLFNYADDKEYPLTTWHP